MLLIGADRAHHGEKPGPGPLYSRFRDDDSQIGYFGPLVAGESQVDRVFESRAHCRLRGASGSGGRPEQQRSREGPSLDRANRTAHRRPRPYASCVPRASRLGGNTVGAWRRARIDRPRMRVGRKASAPMGGDVFEPRRQCSNLRVRVSGIPPGGAGRVEPETLARPMRLRRSDGPPHQLAAAVRAYVQEDPLGTVGAPRTLVRADSGIVRLRREVAITKLAVGANFKSRHRSLSPFWSSFVPRGPTPETRRSPVVPPLRCRLSGTIP